MANPPSASASLSPTDLKYLADHGHVVVENFLSPQLQQELWSDVASLRSTSNSSFKVAKIGHDGAIQDESTPFRDIRRSESCWIGSKNEPQLPSSSVRLKLYAILAQLKQDLNSNEIIAQGHCTQSISKTPLDTELEELMYVHYPKGGYYRRHVDAEPDTVSSIRQYSLLLYLNHPNEPLWDATQHGGQLRLHFDSGYDKLPNGELPNYRDISPTAGTLVLFRSDGLPHEVLETRRERVAIVGWFLSSEQQPNAGRLVRKDTVIDPETLSALIALRDASPRLKARLSPPPVNVANAFSSGLLGDDFLGANITSTTTTPTEDEEKDGPDETTVEYWKKIAAFHPVSGTISTLSLGGNRLKPSLLPILVAHKTVLLENVTTLDLANTDLSAEEILTLLPSNLQALHLGGNALSNAGVIQLVSTSLPVSLAILDLRYNDIGVEGATALKQYFSSATTHLQLLYLEGNQLGNLGVQALAGVTCRELYLGQNQIQCDGAIAFAEGGLKGLQKLYLEGNGISDAGALALCRALEEDANKTVEKLYIDNNPINKEIALRLSRAVNSPTCMGEGGIFQE